MLEILVLYFLCKQMGTRLRSKGWKKTVWMQIAVVLVWFVCMLIGMIGYGIYRAIKEGDAAAAEHLGFMIYPPGVLIAAIGVGLLFGIVLLLPNRNPSHSFTNCLTSRYSQRLCVPSTPMKLRPRKDRRGVDLISDALPFGRLWYDTPDHAIGLRDALQPLT